MFWAAALEDAAEIAELDGGEGLPWAELSGGVKEGDGDMAYGWVLVGVVTDPGGRYEDQSEREGAPVY